MSLLSSNQHFFVEPKCLHTILMDGNNEKAHIQQYNQLVLLLSLFLRFFDSLHIGTCRICESFEMISFESSRGHICLVSRCLFRCFIGEHFVNVTCVVWAFDNRFERRFNLFIVQLLPVNLSKEWVSLDFSSIFFAKT